jgi:cell wall-associated NlpC family hydrolase
MRHKLLFSCAFVLSFAPAASSAMSINATVADPISHAYSTLGTRYRYGGETPDTGFDCSGLVAHVFQQAWGMSLPRNASAQSKVGIPVKPLELEPGDLLFYNTRNKPYSHVGIYVGDGRFIHAPRSGQRVRLENALSPYWKARFNGARRLGPPSY